MARNLLIMLNNLQQTLKQQIKLLQKESFNKTAEATDDLIGNKIANRITKVSKNSQQNNSETVTNEHDKEKCVPPEVRQEIVDEVRLNSIMEY